MLQCSDSSDRCEVHIDGDQVLNCNKVWATACLKSEYREKWHGKKISELPSFREFLEKKLKIDETILELKLAKFQNLWNKEKFSLTEEQLIDISDVHDLLQEESEATEVIDKVEVYKKKQALKLTKSEWQMTYLQLPKIGSMVECEGELHVIEHVYVDTTGDPMVTVWRIQNKTEINATVVRSEFSASRLTLVGENYICDYEKPVSQLVQAIRATTDPIAQAVANNVVQPTLRLAAFYGSLAHLTELGILIQNGALMLANTGVGALLAANPALGIPFAAGGFWWIYGSFSNNTAVAALPAPSDTEPEYLEVSTNNQLALAVSKPEPVLLEAVENEEATVTRNRDGVFRLASDAVINVSSDVYKGGKTVIVDGYNAMKTVFSDTYEGGKKLPQKLSGAASSVTKLLYAAAAVMGAIVVYRVIGD